MTTVVMVPIGGVGSATANARADGGLIMEKNLTPPFWIVWRE